MRLAFASAALVALVQAAGAAEFRYLAPGEPGRTRCGPLDPGWERADYDDGDWAAPADAGALRDMTAPHDMTSPRDGGARDGGARDGGGPPPCPVLRARRRFDVGDERARLATLTLRVRYQDGFIAWLNGVEVARRRLVDGAEWATETHGPERESFTIPVAAGLLRERDNVLAVEVRPARPTRRAYTDVSLDGADGARITRGPYLQRVGATEGWIVVETDLPTRLELRYGKPDPAGAPQRTVEQPAATRHTVHLTRLSPATTYRYEIALRPDGSDVALAAQAEFHTPPAGEKPLRFAVFGDVRSGHEVHARLVQAVVAEDPDLVLMTGDLVDRGNDEAEWERYFDIAAPLLRQIAVYPAPGNHEYDRRASGISRFLSLFLRPTEAMKSTWWSFDVAGVHFALLDSEAYGNPDQRAWLENDLAQARKRRARAIFVVAHDGPFSSALHGDNKIAVRDYAPIYDRYKVSLVFSGHDHDYERLRVGATDYIVSGGGGAELRRPRCGVNVPGMRRCAPRTRAFANEHHYVMVEVQRNHVRVCPKRPDGTLLEACPIFPLRR